MNQSVRTNVARNTTIWRKRRYRTRITTVPTRRVMTPAKDVSEYRAFAELVRPELRWSANHSWIPRPAVPTESLARMARVRATPTSSTTRRARRGGPSRSVLGRGGGSPDGRRRLPPGSSRDGAMLGASLTGELSATGGPGAMPPDRHGPDRAGKLRSDRSGGG